MSYKQKYPSKLGATRLITAPHFLTEFILLRHAESRQIKLPNRIWDKKKFSQNLQWKYWYGLYNGEHKIACRLLQTFELNDILATLKDGEGRNILSLSNKKLRRLIKETYNTRLIREKHKEENIIIVGNTDVIQAKPSQKKSKMGKLR